MLGKLSREKLGPRARQTPRKVGEFHINARRIEEVCILLIMRKKLLRKSQDDLDSTIDITSLKSSRNSEESLR